MQSLKSISLEQQQRNPVAFDDPEKDRLFAALLQLAEEVCVLRDRLTTVDALAATGAACDADAISAYTATDEEVAERLKQHKRFYEELFASIISD